MGDLSEDVGIGIYRSIDDVKHLKVRVHVRKVAPSSLPVQDSRKLSRSSDTELLQLQSSYKASFSERVFSWQEKVSKEEEKELSASSLKLHKSEREKRDSEKCMIKLFSYVDSEVRSKSEFSGFFHGSTSDSAQTMKKRNISSLSSNKTYQRPFILDPKEVVQIPSSKQRICFTGQSMAIMASIEGDDCDPVELQLCLIHYDDTGTLIAIPAFSNFPYYIKTAKSGTYELALENASRQPSSSDNEKERSFRQQAAENHDKAVAMAVGTDFDMPSPKSLILYLNGEIVSATGFDASNIFVRYTFRLPEGMTATSDAVVAATTHSCKVKDIKGVRKAHFGFPFSFSAETDPEKFQSSGAKRPSLQMTIDVCSVDSWGICRSEGYGYCDIAIRPGSYSQDITMWKLLPQNLVGALKTFFIGGIPDLDDRNYAGIPKDEDKVLNKYSAKTETSGTVALNLHVLLHFGCETSSDDFINKQQITSNH